MRNRQRGAVQSAVRGKGVVEGELRDLRRANMDGAVANETADSESSVQFMCAMFLYTKRVPLAASRFLSARSSRER
jgi:hypothetical protein